MERIRVEKKIGKGTLSFETGIMAKQASGCVKVQYNETVVLSAAATGPARPGIDFFPLMCDYRERTAAAGKFPGGFIKREGRPTTKEILTARLIDRPIRPSFAEGFQAEVQIQNFVLASDRQTDGDVLAMNGSCAALGVSELPFLGPLASVRMGRVEGELIPFPSADELVDSDLDLIVSGTKDAILMIEGFAKEMPEDEMIEALAEAHRVVGEICDLQQELIDKVAPTKIVVEAPVSDGLAAVITDKYATKFAEAIQIKSKAERNNAIAALKLEAQESLIPDAEADGAYTAESFSKEFGALKAAVIRKNILAGNRQDGRDNHTVRDLYSEVDVLPRVHGSALFQRGETQALITITLGTGRDEQRVDGLFEEYSKRFMLDYNFPSFSVGECRPIRGPGRREIGHGMLAERSVAAVLPSKEDFPYTIRIISDILESNGSSSMASVCGSTLALMAAGVPLTNPVAGISVGLVKDGEDWTLLTDILGDEDHYGDMDFKIAGTQVGITGIQLDLKINGISQEIMRATLAQSREARIGILRSMLSTISRPREEMASDAPRLMRTSINPEKIGLLIGPGGKTIRGIQEATGVTIDIDEDGSITIAGSNLESVQAGLDRIDALTASVQIGRIYEGKITSVKDFGAFVEILPGKDGLCHVSELSNDYVSSVADFCKVGDVMRVKVLDVDAQDRVKLSARAAKIEDEAGSDAPEEAAAE